MANALLTYAFFASFAFINGLVICVNLGSSGVLAGQLGSPLFVACVNYFIAFVLEGGLLSLHALTGEVQGGMLGGSELRKRVKAAPLWVWCGGLFSVYTLTTGIAVAAKVGLVLTNLTIMSGHIVASVSADFLGLSGKRHRACPPSKAAGLALVLAGASVVIFGHLHRYTTYGAKQHDAEQHGANLQTPVELSVYLVMLVLVGVCIPGMGLVNGRLMDVLGHPLRTASVSDAIASLVLLCLSLLAILIGGVPLRDPVAAPWWSWLGGPGSAAFTCIIIIVPKRIGMSVYSCSFIAGEQFFSVLVDALGLFSAPRPATFETVLGVSIAVAGALVYQWSTYDPAADEQLPPKASGKLPEEDQPFESTPLFKTIDRLQKQLV